MPIKPMVLLILDGWGYREENADNAINNARKPTWDRLWQTHAHTLISASGQDVGLPGRQMGNSEVGHVNLGAGRIVYQSLTRIDKDIVSGDYQHNVALNAAIDKVLHTGNALHLMGLVSDGGVHSHVDHLLATIRFAAQRGVKHIYVHAFLDGRDTPPKSAATYLQQVEVVCEEVGVAQIASLVGRYYAMDRDNRWERVELAYDLLATGKADYVAATAEAGVQAAYDRDETDEFVQPTVIAKSAEHAVRIQAGDAVIFTNFRADRARELTHAFVLDPFTGFARQKMALADFVTMTEYEAGLPVNMVYPPEQLKNVLGEYLADQGKTQLRIAETEKYAHVTFFFNGGVEQPFANEDRKLIASPKVATYDLQPEMSAPELTEDLVAAIESKQYDVIICNYANSDMVGHTGNYEAAVKAIEAVDACLARVTTALEKVGGEALITADHGNAEIMRDRETGQPYTAHTNLPVPLIYVGRPAKVVKTDGVLSDIAPTLLHMMGMPIPAEMTGRPIFEPKD